MSKDDIDSYCRFVRLMLLINDGKCRIDVARQLGVSAYTMRKWMAAGRRVRDRDADLLLRAYPNAPAYLASIAGMSIADIVDEAPFLDPIDSDSPFPQYPVSFSRGSKKRPF